ncbi:lactonase family protein [Brochothrix thermosphacta]|uniref:lactonase family protein n=1 Tax=Brochothrix thermosphacta TaxID=2756 RepID=UPI0039B05A86
MSNERVYFGTYTKKASQGIYTATVNNETAELSNVAVAGKVDNPTYLTIDPTNSYLYSIAKVDGKGGIQSFKINEDATLTPLNNISEEGAPPCYVAINNAGNVLYTANYHRGLIDSVALNEDGSIDRVVSRDAHEGKSINPERQDKAYAHYSDLTPDGKFVLGVDLGTDEIYSYKVNGAELERVAILSVKPGSGPRHLVFTKDGETVYIMTELSNEVIVAKFNKETGGLVVKQTIYSLPEDFKGANKGSAIRITPNEKTLYVSNRGYDGITAFDIAADGTLSVKQFISSFGVGPRDINVNAAGTVLIAANEDTGTATSYKINAESGELTAFSKEVSVPETVAVSFLNNIN